MRRGEMGSEDGMGSEDPIRSDGFGSDEGMECEQIRRRRCRTASSASSRFKPHSHSPRSPLVFLACWLTARAWRRGQQDANAVQPDSG
eukprot:2030113-Rhodomonas_salina.1